MLIDITQTTKIGKVYRPGSSPLKVEKVSRSLENGIEYSTISFTCDTHNMGTHIDVMETNVIIDIERLIAPGIKFDISNILDRPVMLKDIDTSLVKKGVFVFFQSSNESQPEISMEVLEYLVSKEVNMVGIDASGLAIGRNHALADKYLGEQKKYAIENLTNLELLPVNNFKVYCLPIKIEGIDTLPVRILVEF